jgi:hypothetical protein
MFEVRFYSTNSDVALMNGADGAEEYEEMEQAIIRARSVFINGYYPRAIVVNDDKDDIYDTAYDTALSALQPLPEVAPVGPRQRPSSLAERVLV